MGKESKAAFWRIHLVSASFCRDLPFGQTAHSEMDVGAPETRKRAVGSVAVETLPGSGGVGAWGACPSGWTLALLASQLSTSAPYDVMLLGPPGTEVRASSSSLPSPSFLPSFFLQWRETRMFLGTMVPVLQACRTDSLTRTIRSPLMERKGARHLLMDITFTQEAEPDGQLRPLHVYLSTSDSRSKLSQPVAELQTTEPFPQESSTQQVFRYLRNRTALELGPVPMQGFQLAFSYSGTCVFITSIRLYYRKCPDISDKLVSFRGTAAGSASVAGSCMEGVVEVSPPVRECAANGSWGPLRGRCSCQPGHQIADGSCRGASNTSKAGICPESRPRPRGRALTLTTCVSLAPQPVEWATTNPPPRRRRRVEAVGRAQKTPGHMRKAR